MTSVMECYHALVDPAEAKHVDACVLWEPHYRAFQGKYGMRLLNDETNYSWFLCLVAKETFLVERDRTARNMLAAMRTVTRRCNEEPAAVIKACVAYLQTEFTGVGTAELEELLYKGKHHFGVDDNVDGFMARLKELGEKGGAVGSGAVTLATSLWPRLAARAV